MKENCWDYKKCGCEAGGSNVTAQGACAASTEHRLNGVHGGTNGGRACWVVAGTFCDGKVQGGYSEKIVNCRACDFFIMVNEQEGHEALKTVSMLNMLC